MRERERARRDSETAKQREEPLRRQRMRDRARRAAQTIEQRKSGLQQRHDGLVAESTQEREARLEQMRDHWLLSQLNIERSQDTINEGLNGC